MHRLRIIFAESSVETIPGILWNNRSILKDSKKRKKHPSRILLDSSKHHGAMKTLPDYARRGRPDVIHSPLLLILDSYASARGLLEVYVHTIRDEIIEINPGTRLPRNYTRFVGLLEDLYEKRTIKHGEEVLLRIVEKDLKSYLKGKVVVMDRNGEGNYGSLKREIRNGERGWITVIIGGFPHGKFRRDYPGTRISLGDESYSTLYVTSKVLCAYENVVRGWS